MWSIRSTDQCHLNRNNYTASLYTSFNVVNIREKTELRGVGTSGRFAVIYRRGTEYPEICFKFFPSASSAPQR